MPPQPPKTSLARIGLIYDVAGNVTKDNLGNTITHDAEDRIATIAGFTYSYDADGMRMEKTSGSSGTMYWRGAWGTLAETDLTGSINEEYVYFNGLRIARVDRPSGTVHYYFSNHLGSHTLWLQVPQALASRTSTIIPTVASSTNIARRR